MISSGVDIRIDRRVDYFRKWKLEKTIQEAKNNQNYHEQSQETPISTDFIEKFLIWLSASFSACLFILFIELFMFQLLIFIEFVKDKFLNLII